jgi:hypothetical protein
LRSQLNYFEESYIIKNLINLFFNDQKEEEEKNKYKITKEMKL